MAASEPATGGILDQHRTSAGLLLALLGQAAMRRLRDAHNLTPRQFQLLGVLYDQGPTSQRALAQVMDVDPSILVCLLNPLEADGFVSRQRDPADRRRHVVALSPAGADHLAAAAKAQRAAEDLLFAGLDHSQREQLAGCSWPCTTTSSPARPPQAPRRGQTPARRRMADRTIPILPCRSLADNLDFYRALGFEVTFHQQRPNPYAVVERGGIELQFFAMKTYDPARSSSTCYIVTGDVDALHDAFSSGLRAAFGRLPTRGPLRAPRSPARLTDETGRRNKNYPAGRGRRARRSRECPAG